MDLKFPKPNIMLIDMSEAAEKVLQESGYNVSSGSFGTPQKVPRSDKRFVVSSNVFRLPNYQEQEVLIINLEKTPVSDITPQDDAGEGVVALWQQADHGVIDPRPYCMAGIHRAVDRILRHGGIAIVFLDTRREVHYEVAARKFGDYRLKEAYDLSNWSFTSDLQHLECRDRCGIEIEFLPECGELTALLRRGAADAQYQCAVHPNWQIEKHWRPIAKNRFDDDVAGILFSDDPQSCLILLPQMPNVSLILPDLIGTFCPRLRPKLFPHHEANSWLHDEQYEVPAIVQLFREINSIKEETV